MFKRKTLLSLVAFSSLALTACGTTDDTSELDDATPTVVEQEDTATEKSTDDFSDKENVIMNPVEAFDIFLDKYPDAKVTEIKLEENKGQLRYKIEGFKDNTEYELKINSVGGEILKESVDKDNDDRNDGEITRIQIEKVTDLVNEALADAGNNASLDEWQVEMNDGIAELEIELDLSGVGEVEYKYNVDTGELIEKD